MCAVRVSACAPCVPLANGVGTCEARSKRTPKVAQHPPENCPITALLRCLPGWSGGSGRGSRTSAHLEAPQDRLPARLLRRVVSARRGGESRGGERRGEPRTGEERSGAERRGASPPRKAVSREHEESGADP